MKCTICGKPIVLVPSAEERAKKGFGTAQDCADGYCGCAQYYRSLFTTHPECALKKRADETSALIKKRGVQNGCFD